MVAKIRSRLEPYVRIFTLKTRINNICKNPQNVCNYLCIIHATFPYDFIFHGTFAFVEGNCCQLIYTPQEL